MPAQPRVSRYTPRRGRWPWGLAILLVAASANGLAAQTADLVSLTLEDLMNIKVTSASRHEQRIFDTAAAVYVISSDDIRRSGLTSVPEILRLAPGVNVAKIRANTWAVAVRGFNQQFNDKLLVLVDGRSVFNTQNAGVNWETIDLMVEDIDRIEIVRGPGGSVWGANAVNGVINILTKSAAATQGTVVRASVGTQGVGTTAVRVGAESGQTSYRVYGRWSERGHGLIDEQTAAHDGSRGAVVGFRLDRTSGTNTTTIQGDVVDVVTDFLSSIPRGFRPPPQGWGIETSTTRRVSNVLARVTRGPANGRSVEIQGSAKHEDSVDSAQAYRALTLDVDGKFQTHLGKHAIVSGSGFRYVDDLSTGSFAFTFTPEAVTRRVFHAFLQDEIHLADDRLLVTLGTKVEHHTVSGWGVAPTARALWAVTPRQRVWTAISRALRTPARNDLGLDATVSGFIGDQGLPVLVKFRGNPDYKTEQLTSVEGGYRLDLGGAASLDAAVFYSHHERMKSLEPLAPTFVPTPVPHIIVGGQFANLLRADTSGVEVTAQWPVTSWWRLNGGYTFFRINPTLDVTSRDDNTDLFVRGTPQHQVQMRSAWSLGPRVDLGVLLLGATKLALRGVPSYTRADVNLEWRVTPHWVVSAHAQNLFDAAHLEFAGPEVSGTPSLDPRRGGVILTWTF